ncbi:MAG: hypothetical protein IPL40_01890 [Proteobacteria bacterium]|nr:hypothetical protein [Pseudomonadota bacterium]
MRTSRSRYSDEQAARAGGPALRQAAGRAPLGAIAALLLATACGAGTPAPIARLEAAILVDRTVFRFVRLFNVAALQAGTTTGAAVACAEFPSQYRLGDARLRLAGPKARLQVEWQGQEQEGSAGLRVTAGQALVFVIEALAPYTQGATTTTHVVGRGCVAHDGFAAGSASNTLAVDVRASTGAPCQQPTDCERTLDRCVLQQPDFPSGYCTRSCVGDQDCMPGSVCSRGGGFCARVCGAAGSVSDCEGGQECLPRLTVGGSCATLCGPPSWDPAGACS